MEANPRPVKMRGLGRRGKIFWYPSMVNGIRDAPPRLGIGEKSERLAVTQLEELGRVIARVSRKRQMPTFAGFLSGLLTRAPISCLFVHDALIFSYINRPQSGS